MQNGTRLPNRLLIAKNNGILLESRYFFVILRRTYIRIQIIAQISYRTLTSKRIEHNS